MQPRMWQRRLLLAIAVLFSLGLWLVSALFPSPSLAHWADLATAEITIADRSVHWTLTLPSKLLSTLQPTLQTAPDLADTIPTYLRVTARGRGPERVTVQTLSFQTPAPQSALSPTTHRSYDLLYSWERPIQSLKIDYGLFPPGATAAQCIATISQGDRLQQYIFTPQHPTLALAASDIWQQSADFVRLGIEHILTGYDHILFIVSAILVQQPLGSLLKVVTAFTVAHSLTLALATLKIVTLPSILVESTIALSIVYMAYTNLQLGGANHRSSVTFGFGLLHGLGFASILSGVSLAPHELIFSLASFNIGVEVGQLAIVLFVVGLLRQLERSGWNRQFTKWSSLTIIGIGSYWFVQRVFGF